MYAIFRAALLAHLSFTAVWVYAEPLGYDCLMNLNPETLVQEQKLGDNMKFWFQYLVKDSDAKNVGGFVVANGSKLIHITSLGEVMACTKSGWDSDGFSFQKDSFQLNVPYTKNPLASTSKLRINPVPPAQPKVVACEFKGPNSCWKEHLPECQEFKGEARAKVLKNLANTLVRNQLATMTNPKPKHSKGFDKACGPEGEALYQAGIRNEQIRRANAAGVPQSKRLPASSGR